MTKAEAVNWIINLTADIGKIEYQSLWHYEQALSEIREMLEAQPERKPGRWIVKTVNTFEMAYGSTGYEPVYECSLCGGVEESYLRFDEPIMPEDADFPKYCPHCGAKMEGET